jgi:hypothetical protein
MARVGKKPKAVRVREGWYKHSRTGVELARVFVEQWWSVVKWDDEDDPDCYKTAGLEPIRPLPRAKGRGSK